MLRAEWKRIPKNFNLFCKCFLRNFYFLTLALHVILFPYYLSLVELEMKIYVGRSETEECIKNKTKEFKQETHSAHWGINPPLKNTAPPLFLAKPAPLKSANCPSPSLFRKSPPIYWFFVTPSKVGSFSEPPKY